MSLTTWPLVEAEGYHSAASLGLRMNTTYISRQTSMAATVAAQTALNGSSVDLYTQSPLGSTSSVSAGTFSTEYYDYTFDMNNEDGYGPCRYEQSGAAFLPTLYSLLFVVGLLGNSLVIWVIACGVRLRSMTDVCLLNLALADLLLVCTLPFLAHQARLSWIFGDAMCKIVLGAYHIVFYSGIFFITLMSVDRYLAIVHAVYAMRVRTRAFGAIAATATWVASFCASFPELLFHENKSSSEDCFPVYPKTGGAHFWALFGLFKMNIVGLFLPIVIMAFCYSQIVAQLLHSQSSKKQAVRLVLLVVAVFFCCWVPYNVASFFKALELLDYLSDCKSSNSIRLALQVTEVMAYLHSCLNPVLYVFVGQKFRRSLLRLLSRAPCSLCRLLKDLMPQERFSRSAISQTSSLDERSTVV